MPVTVIVGGQFGSEGKGKVAHYLARERGATVAVRVGGTNSGHTVVDDSGTPRVFRMLPTAALLENVVCAMGAGAYVDVDILLREVEAANLPAHRLWIDPNAYVLTRAHKQEEARGKLGRRIASTQSGTGAAVTDRIRRSSARNLAKHDKRLSPFLKPVRSFLRSRLDRQEEIILEGTQGFGLSLLHSSDYPHVTSRDTTAAAFVAEIGLSPLDVEEVVLVIRAFPIRVAGNSGPLPNEVDWDRISTESGRVESIVEYTSVTKKVRRVARFDAAVVREAMQSNMPTLIVLNHLDYVDANAVFPTEAVEKFVQRVEQDIGAEVNYLGFGPQTLIPRGRGQSCVRRIPMAVGR